MSSLYQRRRKKREMNLLPLIDVLVMLIFFAFVTMQFRAAETLNITLPKVDTAGKNEFKGTVTIGVSNEGVMTFNGQVVGEEEISDLLKQVRDVDRDIPVLIAADEETPLRTVAFLMDACRKTGLNKFSLQSR
ncbi:ExbD/TolR family protein [Synoicihabitans lomoniglobus]|uniref:Biopolymer transporter ExbD n=1 Tax=Synoicihabitans lomoniglobus TaxID=2909285 RepID=A0AAF0CSV6_9BACT|nr:biopolymer transporter ExbD [Opitutaceae bacterium LMO-M01]WED67447.1 biopolymer transporter ExbD [Opitutaceae bacterium LMO-M01]